MSTEFNQPAIIILVFPPDQQMQNAPSVRTGFEQTMQYEQAMTALYLEVSPIKCFSPSGCLLLHACVQRASCEGHVSMAHLFKERPLPRTGSSPCRPRH